MKITFAQINTIPGNFKVNFEQIFTSIEKAIEDSSDILVFPELTICGYGVKDLMYNPDFVEKNLQYLKMVCDASIFYSGHIFIGYIDKNMSGSGKPFRNVAAVIHKGMVIGRYFKQLLPFYDVFDEGRYYEPGTELLVVTIKNVKMGVLICEDMWNDKGQDNYNHHDNPVSRYRHIGIHMIVSLNSSPYTKMKPDNREKMLVSIVSSFPGNFKGIAYCNQYGAQDELVFDGNSMWVNGRNNTRISSNIIPIGEKYAVGRIETVNTDKYKDINDKSHILRDDMHYCMCMLGLFDYARKTGFKGIVLGSSGGIDSAVVIAAGSLIFGKENVYGIRMPSIYNSAKSSMLAEDLHKNLGCHDFEVPIMHMPLLSHINSNLHLITGEYNNVADENLQSRMRGQVSMHMANALGLLAVGTCNKCEAATGYFTLFGDSANLFNPLIDLYKLEVISFAHWLNKMTNKAIPLEIITRPPSAELKPNQTDESSLMPYKWLDKVVRLYIEENIITYESFCEKASVDIIACNASGSNVTYNDIEITEKEYNRIVGIIERNEFKRRMVSMGPKLTNKSFGTGRRVPVVKG